MSPYFPLSIAIICEVIGTTALKSSEGFTKLLPSALTMVAYCVSFFLLSIVLKTMPTSIAYAIWAGVGIVLVTVAAWVIHKQHLDIAAIIGIGMIVCGVVVINLFSKTLSH